MRVLAEVEKECQLEDELQGVQGVQVDNVDFSDDGEIDEDFLINFIYSVQVFAIQCIDEFFRDKELYCGGPIGSYHLHSPQHVSLVMNANIASAVPLAYEALERHFGRPEIVKRRGRQAIIPKDIRFVSGMLRNCAQKGIPKCFSGGLLLMHLELCEGVEIENPYE